MFSFLDNLVKGSVLFILDLIFSMGTLIAHPLSGAARLHRDDQDKSKVQMSSITFLALTMIVARAVYAADAESGGGQSRERVLDGILQSERGAAADKAMEGIGKFLTSGSAPSGFAPILAGAMLGVVLIILMLRGVAVARGLEGRHRDRFLATMEYHLGFFLLVLSLFRLRDMSIGTSPEQIGMLDLTLASLFVLATAALGAQFWITLLRTPRLHRFRRQMPRLRRRWSRRGYYRKAASRDERRRSISGSVTALSLFLPLTLIALPLAAIPPILIGVLGKTGGGMVSDWLIQHDRPPPAANRS